MPKLVSQVLICCGSLFETHCVSADVRDVKSACLCAFLSVEWRAADAV